MQSIRELRASQRTTSSLYDTWFTRRVSVYVTAAALRVRLSPNAVSGVNLFVGLAAWALIARGEYVICGVALIHLYAILDSVDGEIARHTRRTSIQGMFLEDYSAYHMIAAYWLAMGFYLGRSLESAWPLALAIGFVAFGRSAMPVARRAVLAAAATWRFQSEPAAGTTNEARLQRPIRFLVESVLHPSHVWAVSTTVLLFDRFVLDRTVVLPWVVAGYLLLSLAKEAAIMRQMAFGDALERDLNALRGALLAPRDAETST